MCALPAEIQASYQAPGWPGEETLTACGAEFLPNTPQDGANALREAAGSGSRVVRVGSRVFSEGDIVGNVLRSKGRVRES